MRILFLSFAILVISGCSYRFTSHLNTDIDRIYFGTGGGFSGKVNQWVVSANGRIYQVVDIGKEKDSIFIIKKISKKITKELFEEYTTIEQNFKPIEDPYNTYTFLRFENSGKNVIYTWNENTTNIEPLRSLYRKLYEQTL